MEILWYEGVEAGPGQSLIIEVEEEERGCKAVKTLPVHQANIVRHPGLENTFQLPMTRGGGEQLVVLVTSIRKGKYKSFTRNLQNLPRDVDFDLPIHWTGRFLVNSLVHFIAVVWNV